MSTSVLASVSTSSQVSATSFAIVFVRFKDVHHNTPKLNLPKYNVGLNYNDGLIPCQALADRPLWQRTPELPRVPCKVVPLRRSLMSPMRWSTSFVVVIAINGARVGKGVVL